jgi:hypothetical protein
LENGHQKIPPALTAISWMEWTRSYIFLDPGEISAKEISSRLNMLWRY